VCAGNLDEATVISHGTIDSAAFVRFEVPDVARWSIGFMYHEVDSDSYSVTHISTASRDDIFADHVTKRDGRWVHVSLPVGRIDLSVLRTGPGQRNELSFRTSSDGSFLRLNDEIVIEVPASQLIRRNGRSRLCVGFLAGEDEPYSMRYWDFRKRFARARVSGSLTHSGNHEDRRIVCPMITTDHAFLSDHATDSWVVLDFVAPDVGNWSIALVHQDRWSNNSRTVIQRNGNLYYVYHTNFDDGQFHDGVIERVPGSSVNRGFGETNRLEFETTEYGTSLFLNGEKVLDVPSVTVTRRLGSVRLCTGLYEEELEPYTIRYSNLWAWTD